MQTIVKTQTNTYTITTGRGILKSLRSLLPFTEGKKVMIVTDDNVARYHLNAVKSEYPEAHVFVIEHGEGSKSFQNAERIAEELAKHGFTRADYVFALGGGVVGDLSGFVSSIYMRGIPYVQIPTSLLAGIDSSVGGKTAVNIAYGKNLVGRVYPPSAVVFDLDTLSTLSKDFFLDGTGEAVKYAVLDKDIFSMMEEGDLSKNLEEIVDACVRYKKKIVELDENESGPRRLLNLGHTLGHAIERETGLRVTHGVAVASGLDLIVRACENNGLLSSADGARIRALLKKYGLPKGAYRVGDLVKHVAVDKKTVGGVVNLVTVHGIGDCRIEPVPLERLFDFFSTKAVISPGGLSGVVEAIPSKSYAHRILLCAALSDGETEIEGLYPSEDVLATIRCVRELGARIDYDGKSKAVVAGPARANKGAIFDCGESGSTLRFLLPVAAAVGAEGTFFGRGRLPDRPLTDLTAALRAAGATFSSDRLPTELSGRLESGTITVDGSASSQYVSGLLIALSVFPERRTLRVIGRKVSESYIGITLSVLREFGVDWKKTSDGYEKGEGVLVTPRKILVEGDWSNAAFFLAAGAVGDGAVTVKGLRYPSAQGDSKVVDILRGFGAEVEQKRGEVTVRPSRVVGQSVDLKDCPDLGPILSVVAACAEGETVFNNVGRLKIKESDRLLSIIQTLRSSGIVAETDGEILCVKGGKPSYADYDGYGDHRMVMSEAILSLKSGGEIEGIRAVNKSYPDFFEDFSRLGGKYVRV
ncbi:MAG: 3-phosphoshikimate 1-carboxyvinyltransferase [Clostridia bacterium]|nr:3-phosphoshikimate 1-carboxyvinyltransferase [Clostridia bacterium]